ncbi:MAG: DUF362 domain-containing protein, partial [Nanoarchaeota archaeon]
MNRTIRWICKNCNKKWIQPVETCIFCKGKTEKQIGRKLRVIGFTKVNIPSVMHPIVPYNILLLEDELGNKMPKKTIRDYNMGDDYEVLPSKDRHAVSITKIKYDVDSAIEEALYLIGGIKVNAKTRILLKPNIMSSAYKYLSVTTHPKILSAIITYLLSNGALAKNIALAEQCIYNPIDDALVKSGIGEVCKHFNIRFLDIAKGDFEEREINGMKFNISKIPNYDLIINVPVLKTHLLFGISGAFENMTRFVAKENLLQLQKTNIDLNKVLVILNKILPKYLTIGDGMIGMQGNWPLNGECAFLNYVLASHDAVAHDAVFAELGMFLRNPKYLDIAEKEGLGIADINKIP